MNENAGDRLKRLKMRSWRRGTKEMDMILGPYADANLASLEGARLDLYESLLEENDQDLYPWISGQAAPPARLAPLLEEIGGFIRARLGREG